MLQLELDKDPKKEFEMKLKDGVHEDPYIGGSYYHDATTLKENVLNGILTEEVYKLEFNCIDETKAFSSMFA